MASRRLLITDLDNTLWDWHAAWNAAFSALLDGLIAESGVPRVQLESEIRALHQANGTTEYTGLVDEIPSLIQLAGARRPSELFVGPIDALRSARREATVLYPGVMETLIAVRAAGIRIVAYTDSLAYWTEWRLKRTGLDGVIDVLYSAPDHPFPEGVRAADFRTRGPENYGLKVTRHVSLPRGAVKPNADVLRQILQEEGVVAAEALYVGDSLMKDIAMAQDAGVLDVHASYGVAHERADYELLRRVTHWTDADVERESRSAREITPTIVLGESFSGLLEILDV